MGRGRASGDTDKRGLRVCLAGGGSGGHVYPCIAVAEAIRRRHRDAELLLIGARRGADTGTLAKQQWPYRLVSTRALPYGPSLRWPVSVFWLAWAQLESLAILGRFRPHVVVATGGHVCAGVVPAARLLRIPVVLHDSDALGGRTTRLLARCAAAITIGSEPAMDVFPRAKTHFTGQPLRSDILTPSREAGRELFGLSATAKTLLVTGGSYGARRLNEATVGALRELLSNGAVQILHIAGEADYPWTADRVADLGIDDTRYRLLPYVDEMGHALAAADVIICRAGANTLAEAAARRVPAIVVPYPHAGAHQEANARPFVEAGAAAMVRDTELSAEKLAEIARTLLADEPRRRRMAGAASALAPRDAADAVADIVIGMARGAQPPSRRHYFGSTVANNGKRR